MPLEAPAAHLRARPVIFTLDGRGISIPPVSIEQARQCLLLDPKPDHQETAAEHIIRLCAQAEILFGPDREYLLRKLNIPQTELILDAVYVAACGHNPESFALWQHAQRQYTNKQTAVTMLAELDRLTVELAAHLSKLPSEVGAVPLADAVALRAEIAKQAEAELSFQAAIHGATGNN